MSPRWDVDLTASAGGFRLRVSFGSEARVLALFGANGAGKSTLVECLAGVRPAEGRLVVDGRPWLVPGAPAVLARRRRIGWVPQDGALFPHLTVRQNLGYGMPAGFDAARVIQVLGLAPLLDRRPDALSGGERRRAALGRALCSDPRLLLLDEPLSGVDLRRRARVFRHLLAVRDEFGLPMLFVSHDPAEVLAVADEVVLLREGCVVGQGAPGALLADAAALRLLDRFGFENVLLATPEEAPVAGRALTVRTPAGTRLVAPPPPADLAERGWLAVRAEDVLLAAEEPRALSARNVLPGKVAAVEEASGHLLVRVVAGDEWVATLTRRAVRELGLEPGRRAWVVVKTHAMHWLAD